MRHCFLCVEFRSFLLASAIIQSTMFALLESKGRFHLNSVAGMYCGKLRKMEAGVGLGAGTYREHDWWGETSFLDLGTSSSYQTLIVRSFSAFLSIMVPHPILIEA